jgi:hypothetical protein
MKPDFDSHVPDDEKISSDCAEPRRVASAHHPRRHQAEGEREGAAAPTVVPSFFDEHGISRRVGDARPYLGYEQGDPDRLLREHWPSSPKFAAKIARQSSGIIIPRYPPASLGLPNVPAEIRPDTAVVTSSHHHFHGDDPETADLTFPSTENRLPPKWIHTPEERARHIEKVHGGNNVQTVHLDENKAKYVFPPGDGAKRLDIHPLAWSRFTNASRVMIGIEGCIKADAMFSAGEAVISFPSVTLWRAPELAAAVRYLRDKAVYIVPDADWITNGNVITQAMFFRTFLRKRGVKDTHVAAPPFEVYKRDRNIKGVDDHFVHGGTMNDLEVLERETPYGLAEWLAERRTWRKDKVVLGAEVLEALALHADRNGEIRASLRSVANIMGVHHSRVERGVKALEECGVIEIEGSLATYARHYDKEKGWVGWDWEERPVIRIAPELRAKDTTHPLGA